MERAQCVVWFLTAGAVALMAALAPSDRGSCRLLSCIADVSEFADRLSAALCTANAMLGFLQWRRRGVRLAPCILDGACIFALGILSYDVVGQWHNYAVLISVAVRVGLSVEFVTADRYTVGMVVCQLFIRVTGAVFLLGFGCSLLPCARALWPVVLPPTNRLVLELGWAGALLLLPALPRLQRGGCQGGARAASVPMLGLSFVAAAGVTVGLAWVAQAPILLVSVPLDMRYALLLQQLPHTALPSLPWQIVGSILVVFPLLATLALTLH